MEGFGGVAATTSSPAKSTIDEFEMDLNAPYPEVHKYYDIKVEGLKTHNFGTRFIELRITFNNLEDQPLLDALESSARFWKTSLYL